MPLSTNVNKNTNQTWVDGVRRDSIGLIPIESASLICGISSKHNLPHMHIRAMISVVLRQTTVLFVICVAMSFSAHAQRQYGSAFNISGLYVSVIVLRVDSSLTCRIDIRNGSIRPMYMIDLAEWQFDRDYWFWRDDRYIVDGGFEQPVPNSGWWLRRLNPLDTCSRVISGVRYLWPDSSVVRVVVGLIHDLADVQLLERIMECPAEMVDVVRGFADRELLEALESSAACELKRGNCIWIPVELIDRMSLSTFETRVGVCQNCTDQDADYPH